MSLYNITGKERLKVKIIAEFITYLQVNGYHSAE